MTAFLASTGRTLVQTQIRYTVFQTFRTSDPLLSIRQQ